MSKSYSLVLIPYVLSRDVDMRKKERFLIPCECTNPDCHEMILNFGKDGKPHRFKLGHHAYKGGRNIDGDGYIEILCKGHHHSNHNGYVKEHILVFENTYNCCVLGPKLASIHHINRVRTDNRPENLEGMSHRQHMSLHARNMSKETK